VKYGVALGRVIFAQRVLRGVKRRELAVASGLSYPYLSEIEVGAKEPTLNSLRHIARALDTNASDLLRLTEHLIALDEEEDT